MTHDEREQIARGEAADALLQHPLIAEALDHYEQELTQAWRTSKPKDAQGREEVHRMLLAAAHFRAYLKAVTDNGKVVQARVMHQRSLLDRARDRMGSFRRVA